MPGYIQIDGLREFNRAVRMAADTELPKRIGQANKHIGALVVSKLSPRPDPRAVGISTGATVRPSASKREVVLRVGGSHRASGRHTRKQQWGRRRVVPPGTRTPPRPDIQGTARAHQDEIGGSWLKAIAAAMSGAFYRTEP